MLQVWHGSDFVSDSTRGTSGRNCDFVSDSSSKLVLPTEESSSYVQKVSVVATFCYQNFLSSPKISKTIIDAALQYISSPSFCSFYIKEKTISLIVCTILHYRLKWLNDSVRSTKNSSDNKLKK